MLETRAAHSRHFSISVFDPHSVSAETWQKFHRYWRLRTEEDHPGERRSSDADTEHAVREYLPLQAFHRVLASCDGEFIGSLTLSFRREGSPDCDAFAPYVDAWGGVLQPHRRRGVARALLHALLVFMDERGKTTASIRAHLPEGHAFLSAIGAVEKHRAIENRAALATMPWNELAHWQSRAFDSSTGLRAEIHAGRVPFDRLAELIEPMSALINDAPTNALEMPRIRYELEAYRTWYADMDRRGGEHFLVLLLDGDEVAAVCDASWDQRFPDRMYQQLTAVAPRWRGRGLAKGVKAAMLALVRERHPEVATAITNNAEVNAPMLAINHRLGFAAHRHDGVYQIGPESLRAFLSTRPLTTPTERHP